MAKLHVVRELPIAADAYWQVAHTSEYETVVAEVLGLKELQELEARQEGDVLHRRLRVIPDVEIPGAVRKVIQKQLGDDEEIAYEEIQANRLDRYERLWEAKMPFMTDKIRSQGKLEIEPIDDHHCRMILTGNVDVKVFGVGGMIEKLIVNETEKSYSRFPEVVERWNARQG